jgi:hypothetical protein
MSILDGLQAGAVYRITDNGTHSVTVDRNTLITNGTIVPATDRVALFPLRRKAEETIEWILVDSFDGFVPENEWEELFAQTRDGEPYRTTTYLVRKKIAGTIEFTPQNANLLPLMFGKCVDVPTTYSGMSSQLKVAVYPGDTEVSIKVITNATVGDYIAVGATTDQEIRAISDLNGSLATLDYPLRRYHAINASVRECTGTYYTHTYSMYYDNVYRQWPFEVLWEQSTTTGTGTITHYAECQVNGVSFRNDGDKLKISLDCLGYYYTYVNNTPLTAPTAINASVLIYKNSEVSINSVVDGKVRSVDCSWNYGGEPKYYHTTANDYYPTEICFGRAADISVNLGLRIEDNKFLVLHDAGTEFDAYAKYNWNGTEYLKITFENCRAKTTPHPLPAGGPIEVDWNVSPQYITVEVKDTAKYH